MCGFIGIIARGGNVSSELYFALHTLQHRGQNGTGILTFDGSGFHLHKKPGLVSESYSQENLKELKGRIGLGHVRYPTIGSDPKIDAQPFLISQPTGIGICHNGNLVNYDEVRKLLLKKHKRAMKSNCDVEAILNLFAAELQNLFKSGTCKDSDIFNAIKSTMEQLNGGYSCISIISGKGLLAFRDQNAIRPLIFGEKIADGKVIAYGFASESVALDALGFRIVKDLEPGEAVLVDENMKYNSKILLKGKRKHCMFEWVYFARPDSVIENKGVYEARLRLGEELAEIWKKRKIKADVVIPVPDSSTTAAVSFAQALGLPYREGLIKNRYVGRTFIMPQQKQREFGVRLKLSPVIREIKGKSIVLIDDSIVRGTTSKKIVEMVKKAGAKTVHFVITCPPLKYPCFYAVDFASKTELIAAEKEIEEIGKMLGVDTLIYQEIERLKSAIGLNNHLCTACLDGKYATDVSEEQKKLLGETRDRERKNFK